MYIVIKQKRIKETNIIFLHIFTTSTDKVVDAFLKDFIEMTQPNNLFVLKMVC